MIYSVGYFFAGSYPSGRTTAARWRNLASVKRAQQRARDIDQLDPIGLRKRLRRDDLINNQRRRANFRFTHFERDHRPEGVALSVADLHRVEIQANDGLRSVTARLQVGDLTWKANGVLIRDCQQFTRFPVLRIGREKGLRIEPIDLLARLLRARRRTEHHIHPRRDRSRMNPLGKRHGESRRLRRPNGGGHAQDEERGADS